MTTQGTLVTAPPGTTPKRPADTRPTVRAAPRPGQRTIAALALYTAIRRLARQRVEQGRAEKESTETDGHARPSDVLRVLRTGPSAIESDGQGRPSYASRAA